MRTARRVLHERWSYIIIIIIITITITKTGYNGLYDLYGTAAGTGKLHWMMTQMAVKKNALSIYTGGTRGQKRVGKDACLWIMHAYTYYIHVRTYIFCVLYSECILLYAPSEFYRFFAMLLWLVGTFIPSR